MKVNSKCVHLLIVSRSADMANRKCSEMWKQLGGLRTEKHLIRSVRRAPRREKIVGKWENISWRE